MNVGDLRAEFDHEAWTAAGGTVASYLLILVAMTIVLFGIPWLVFSIL